MKAKEKTKKVQKTKISLKNIITTIFIIIILFDIVIFYNQYIKEMYLMQQVAKQKKHKK